MPAQKKDREPKKPAPDQAAQHADQLLDEALEESFPPVTPSHRLPSGKEVAMIATSNHTLFANGIRQHYIDAGEGPPVVLLHGFPETNFAWRFQIPVLGELFRLIVPDLRGYGETDKPATGYDKRTMARDIAALLDRRIGNRNGSTIAPAKRAHTIHPL